MIRFIFLPLIVFLLWPILGFGDPQNKEPQIPEKTQLSLKYSAICEGIKDNKPDTPTIVIPYTKKAYFYNDFDVGEIAAQFMTITFDVKKKGVERAQAVSHIDNTARPQTVTKKQNESYYNILKAYNDIKGLPIFVNTSFNMHEEPIVCSPYDAVRAFKLGSVDNLAIGNFICSEK